MKKYTLISFICCLLDIISKHIINIYIKIKERKVILPEKLIFINTKNKGIAYNRLESRPKTVKVLTSTITAAFGACFFEIISNKHASVALKLGSALAFGGALGNLIDRFKNGHVTDFIYVKLIKRSPIFNLADIFITFGTILMVTGDLFKR